MTAWARSEKGGGGSPSGAPRLAGSAEAEVARRCSQRALVRISATPIAMSLPSCSVASSESTSASTLKSCSEVSTLPSEGVGGRCPKRRGSRARRGGRRDRATKRGSRRARCAAEQHSWHVCAPRLVALRELSLVGAPGMSQLDWNRRAAFALRRPVPGGARVCGCPPRRGSCGLPWPGTSRDRRACHERRAAADPPERALAPAVRPRPRAVAGQVSARRSRRCLHPGEFSRPWVRSRQHPPSSREVPRRKRRSPAGARRAPAGERVRAAQPTFSRSRPSRRSTIATGTGS